MNVIKHAMADHVWVRLLYEDGFVRLEIEDNGVGFRSDSFLKSGQSAWGLLGMEERASLLGGDFTLKSAPGDGTRVTVRVPCRANIELKEEDEDTTTAGR